MQSRVRQCIGHSEICGISGPEDLYYTEVSITRTYDVFDIEAGGPAVDECSRTTTQTLTTDYVENDDGCPSLVTDITGCEGIPDCADDPGEAEQCRTLTDAGESSYSGAKPAAPAPTRICDDWSEWSDIATIDSEDFRGNGAAVLTTGGTAFQSFRFSAYTVYNADHQELEFRRGDRSLRVPVKIVITRRQYLDADMGGYTEATSSIILAANAGSVGYTIPDPSGNGTVEISNIQFYIPGR